MVFVSTSPSTAHSSVFAHQVTNINKAHHREQMPQLGDCDPKNEFVHWRWQYKFNFKYDFGTTQ